MGFYLSVWKKYAVFNGRAGRKEYWIFSLFDFLVMYGLVGISMMMESPVEYEYASSDIGFFQVAYMVYLIAGFLPRLAVTVRRLHDSNKSGWWVLAGSIPLAGGLVILYMTVQPSDEGDNYFGSMPGSYEEPYV